MKSKINNNAAPQAKRLCGAMKRAALALLLCVLTTMTAWADNVTLTSSTTTWTNGNTYILNSNVTISQRINVTGHVTLQLNSGCTLTATRGIKLDYDETTTPMIKGVLTINGSGTLDIPEADLQEGEYGIGVVNSCELHIEGGTINAHAGAGTAGIRLCDRYGKLFISGGMVNAWRGEATNTSTEPGVTEHYSIGSAIGADGAMSETGGSYGGWDSYCGNITISGGTVNAYGDIGDQYNTPTLAGVREESTCTITILGGTINIQENYLFWCHDLILDYNASTYNNFHINQPAGTTPCPNVGNVHLAKPFMYNNQQITHLNDINSLKGCTITPINNPSTFYTITRNNPDHGTVETQIDGGNTNWAFANQTVAVVTTPDAHYQTGSVTVTGGATLNSNNTFTMPANNVSVTVTFIPTPWSGNGTASDPFIIHTVSDLQDLATGVNNGIPYAGYYFAQDADINCSGYGMTPIGDLTHAHPFKGNYNGQNNKIINYNLGQAYLLSSLFGHTEDATLTNIVMQNCNIDANSYDDSHAAGICASCGSGTTISNCRVTGTIKGKHAAGGIVAAINHNDVSVSNCFADVTVTIVNANGYRGKIYAGTTVHAPTSGCYYYDNGDGVGGCGYDGGTAYSDTEIAPVYTVTASNGLTLAATNATVTHNGTRYFVSGANVTLNVSDNNYSIVGTPTVSGTGATYTLAADRKSMTVTVGSSDVTVNATVRSISGTCGTDATWSLAQDGNGDYTLLTISGTGAMQNYSQNNPAPWGNDITIANVGNGITGIGDYAFANCSSLQRVDINYNGAVSIGSNTFSGCTALQYIVFPSIAAEQQNTAGNWEAYATKRRAQCGSQHFAVTTETGTAVYAIATEQDLRNLAAAVNQNKQYCNGLTFRQTADIELHGDIEPIGYNTTFSAIFKGTYDGGDHTISGLSNNINDDNIQYAGLFGYCRNATVKNVRLVSPTITSSSNYYGNGACVGTIVGYSSEGHIENCWVYNPTVSATASSNRNEVGGLIGESVYDTIQNSFVISPTVSGESTTYVGAICGYAHNSSGSTSHCTLTNVYYYNSSLLNTIGFNENSQYAHLTNVGRVRKVTLGSGMANVSPTATNMDNGFVYDNVSYYREGLQLTLTDNFGTTSEGYTKHYYANGTDLNGSTYTVNSTDGDVTFTADCRSDSQQHGVTYVDANGTEHSTSAIPLDGTMTTLNGTYYVGANITFTSTITLNGNTTLILVNGKTMNVGTSDNRISGKGIKGEDKRYTLTIYGQSLDDATAGHLSIYNSGSDGIYLENYNQQSGNVTVNSTTNGNYTINCNYFTLSGGKLNAINNHIYGIGIFGNQQILILGGQLDTYVSNNNKRALTSFNSITLGWTNATDYIYADTYYGTVNIASGQVFVTNDPTPDTITGNNIDISRINGKTLRPILTGSGTTDDPYLITNAGGWDLFCDLVQNSIHTFQGNVKLGADISVRRMAGSESKPFAGNFDGQNYTLTFNCNTSDDYVAPFRYVIGGLGNVNNHATISNLNVASTINGSTHLAGLIANQKGLVDLTNCHVTATIISTASEASYCAGLVSHAAMREATDPTGYGAHANNGTLTISGCTVSGSISTYGKYAGGFVGMAEGKTSIVNSVSSVTIRSFVGNEGTHGGFIGLQQHTLNYANISTTIEGCLFNGKLITSNGTTNCGGFIGWHDGGELTIEDCLYAPADLANGETEISNGYTFVGNGTVGDNCIYTRTLGTAQGKATHNITAGDYVTISNMALINFLSNPAVYNVSGITSYDWDGISCGGNLYICEGAHVSLVLSNDYPDPAPAGSVYGYTATAGTLEGTANPYTLTMPDDDVIINVDTENPIALDWGGTGTEDDPYMIYNKEQLDLLAYRVNRGTSYGPGSYFDEDEWEWIEYDASFFKLGADIVYDPDVLTIDNDEDGTNESNYTAIGVYGLAFSGNFDGDGHTISGIRVIKNGEDYESQYQGLFGYVYDGTVKNVTLADARITGFGITGGIVGYNNGTITNCHVAADVAIQAVKDYATHFGGIAGANDGTISHCTSAVQLTVATGLEETGHFGGIAGANFYQIHGTLSDNLVIGATIPAAPNNMHGAICGYNNSYNGTLERNYYVACTVAGAQNATGVGCSYYDEEEDDDITADITEDDGAMPGNARIVEGYGTSEEVGWTFIASPLTENTDPDSEAVVDIISASEYDLYRLNPSSEMWENWKEGTNNVAPGFSLENGRGYLYATQQQETVKFIGENNAFNMDDTKEVTLPQGFNLVGNPFPRAAYINKPYYTLNAEGSAVLTETSTGYISPCMGVVVEVENGNDPVIFRTTPFPEQSTNNNGNLNIALTQVVEPVETPARDGNGLKVGPSTLRQAQGPALLDNAIVSFNVGCQLGKFYFGTQNANIYLPQGEKEYAIAYSDGYGEMPVNFRANENGQYTITVNPENVEMIYLHLIDNMTGADVDLLAPNGGDAINRVSTYTFNAKVTDYESRFKLVFVCGDANDDNDGDNETFAFFFNGSWIIANEGEATLQVIDLNGRILSSETVNGSVSKSIHAAPGVYMIRLINGNDVKVQKVVIE